MKKIFKTFILAIYLILPAMFCLTACGENETAKVSSFSVELANTSYTLVDDTITVTYGGDYRLSANDFSITATFDDDTSKTLTASELEDFGFTFESSISNDDITPVGEYTLTFGHKNLAESDYITIKVNVVKKSIDVNTLGLTWTDDVTPLVYNGQEQTIEITNLPEYLEVENYNNNREKYPNGAVYPSTHTNIPEKHYAVATIKVKDEYSDRYVINGTASIQHEWIIAKAEMSVPDIDFTDALENYTYYGAPITTKIKDEIKTQLENLNISTSLSGSTTQTNAGEYQVTISFTYTGEDKTCYNLGDEYLIGTRDATWKIYPKEIDVSGVELMVKGGNTYSNAFIYDKNEKSVVFDLSFLKDEGYINESVWPLENALPSTGIQILGFNTTGTFSATNAGKYTVTITFSISSVLDYQRNYKFKDTEDSEVTITKQWKIDKQIIYTSDIGLRANGAYYTDESLTYNGKQQQIFFDMSDLNCLGFYSLSGDSILSYTETGTIGTDADTYTATINFTVNDDNYTVSDTTVSRQWKIKKKELSVIAEFDKSFTYGVTNEEIIANVKLAPLGYPGIEDFVDGEGVGEGENGAILYNTLYNAITFKIGVSDYDSNTYTGKLNVGTYFLYPVVPEGLTLKNYELTSNTCVSMTITKADLTLTAKDKTNQSYWYDFDDMYAFTYDGNAKNYTINDVNATGLVNGDTLESLDLTFEYAKREFKVLDSVLSFTDSDDNLTWTTTAPIDAGAYQVRVVVNNKNYNITSNAGKMLIMRKGVIITLADLTFDYGVKVNELNPTYTLGGDVYYHIGENHYQYVMGYDEGMIGYKPYNITSQEVISILSKLGITLNDEYRFGNYRWDEETDVDTFIPWELSDEDVVGTGTYQITFSQDILDELNSYTNYEFVIVEGRLTIDD